MTRLQWYLYRGFVLALKLCPMLINCLVIGALDFMTRRIIAQQALQLVYQFMMKEAADTLQVKEFH